MHAALPGVVFSLAMGALASASADPQLAPTFAPPVRLMAGDAFLGEDRMFPSPVYYDMNGDGLLDIVVGDLRGLLTVALRQKGADPRAYAAETELKAADGKRLDFHNW